MQFRPDGQQPDLHHESSPLVTKAPARPSVLAEYVPNDVQEFVDSVRKLRRADGTHRSLQHDRHRKGREIVVRNGRSERPETLEGLKMRGYGPPGVSDTTRGGQAGYGGAHERVFVCFSYAGQYSCLPRWEGRCEFGVVARTFSQFQLGYNPTPVFAPSLSAVGER